MSVLTGRFWDELNPAIAQSLSADQRVEIERVLRIDPTQLPSPVGDLRVSFYWFFVRILWGREKRNSERLQQESAQYPAVSRKNVPALLTFGAGYIALWYTVLAIIVTLILAVFFR